MRLYAKIYVFAYVLLVVTMFVLPLFSFNGYSLTQNTISELGAQKVPGNWLANTTIIVLSLAIVVLATKQIVTYWKQLTALYFFCTTLLFTGVYQLAGLDAHQHIFNYTSDALHSLFSMLTGFAFGLFCILLIFILKKRKHQWQTFGVFCLAFIVPLLMWQYPEYRGIYERILFLVSFGWLFYALTTYQFKNRKMSGSRTKHYNALKKHLHTDEK
ncbi:DUF998 domain-containing protein [Rasiella sp. SM2506]|uniref:DUF998 domain-containing protein n=1 Tax=Rasiella sp. SM2506 TaxID=3423914 RepID=UPI003D7AFD6E